MCQTTGGLCLESEKLSHFLKLAACIIAMNVRLPEITNLILEILLAIKVIRMKNLHGWNNRKGHSILHSNVQNFVRYLLT